MLGQFRGRVYYNLINWYRVLSLLPGYRLTARLMERMMGTDKKFIPPSAGKTSGIKAVGALLRLPLSIIYQYLILPKSIRAFYAQIDTALAPYESHRFAHFSLPQLKASYHELEQSILHHWKAPIVNDFFTMIFFGIFKKYIEKKKFPDWVFSGLLVQQGEIISTRPIDSLKKIALHIQQNSELHELFTQKNADWISAQLDLPEGSNTAQQFSVLAQMCAEHIRCYGDRLIEELKLETRTMWQAPAKFVRLVQSYVSLPRASLQNSTSKQSEKATRLYYQKSPMPRSLARFFLEKTRACIRDRENLRFYRTRVFGTIRHLFCRCGQILYAEGHLDDPRDIFFLRKDEIFSLVNATAIDRELRVLVTQRKSTWNEYEVQGAPPDRFYTHGAAVYGGEFADTPAAPNDSQTLSGIGCSQGTITAPIVIVRSADEAADLEGKIMVAEKTDPGWAPLFAMCSAIIVERGSPLSHSAIVAREMGIPAVVGVPGVCNRLTNGTIVTINGSLGTIVIGKGADDS